MLLENCIVDASICVVLCRVVCGAHGGWLAAGSSGVVLGLVVECLGVGKLVRAYGGCLGIRSR